MSAMISWPAQPPPGTHVLVGISQIVPAGQSLSPAPLLAWEPLLAPPSELLELLLVPLHAAMITPRRTHPRPIEVTRMLASQSRARARRTSATRSIPAGRPSARGGRQIGGASRG